MTGFLFACKDKYMKYLVDSEYWGEDFEHWGVGICMPLDTKKDGDDEGLICQNIKIICDPMGVFPDTQLEMMWEKTSKYWCATLEQAQRVVVKEIFEVKL